MQLPANAETIITNVLTVLGIYVESVFISGPELISAIGILSLAFYNLARAASVIKKNFIKKEESKKEDTEDKNNTNNDTSTS